MLTAACRKHVNWRVRGGWVQSRCCLPPLRPFTLPLPLSWSSLLYGLSRSSCRWFFTWRWGVGTLTCQQSIGHFFLNDKCWGFHKKVFGFQNKILPLLYDAGFRLGVDLIFLFYVYHSTWTDLDASALRLEAASMIPLQTRLCVLWQGYDNATAQTNNSHRSCKCLPSAPAVRGARLHAFHPPPKGPCFSLICCHLWLCLSCDPPPPLPLFYFSGPRGPFGLRHRAGHPGVVDAQGGKGDGW